MKLLLLLLLHMLEVEVIGKIGCKKGGNFTPIEGIRVSIYEYDADCDGIFDDFKNETVTNKRGEFKLFAIDAEMMSVQFYVWISLSCEFALREKQLAGCFEHELCKPDASKKFLYTKLEIDLIDFNEKKNSDGIFVCGLSIDIGEFKVKDVNNNYGPQNELMKASNHDNFEPPKETCKIYTYKKH